ncbi:MAG: COQ9 family protein [Pseudomonadota bacterium]
MTDYQNTKDRLLEAILMHVPFDGWSEASFRAALRDTGVDGALARAVCPRGAVDLALEFHRQGDVAMVARLQSEELPERLRDKVAAAVRFRLEAAEDKEVVRRGTTLFALPMYAGDGARAIWGTADAIWTALGDTSNDVNWYTKRATLSAVYSATVLYWLGDDSIDGQATWDFLDRRIDNVMQIEQAKAYVRDNRLLSALAAGPNAFLSRIRAPSGNFRDEMPGSWSSPGE